MELLIDFLSKKHPKYNTKNGEMNTYLDTILVTLTEKLGDKSKNVRELSELAYMSMVNTPTVGPSMCVYSLIKIPNKSIAHSKKHYENRINLLIQIVEKYKINNNDVPFKLVTDFAFKNLEHPDEEVRAKSIKLIVEIYKVNYLF